jgi:hypothetical protein
VVNKFLKIGNFSSREDRKRTSYDNELKKPGL